MSTFSSDGDIDVRTTTTNSNTSLTLQASQSGTLLLPSTLANAILNFNFKLAGNYVTTGITGTATVTGYYLNGKPTALGTINFASNISLKVLGKYTSLVITLNSLSGADTIIAYADQNINIFPDPTAPDGGATSLNITSDDSSIVGVGSYNPTTRALTAELQGQYLPPFTDGVLRTTENKFTDYVSVADFGAVGSGDETAKIRAALNSLSTTGGVLYFGQNVSYTISDTLPVYSNVILNGNGCTITQTTNNFIFTTTATIANLTITNFKLNGGGTFSSFFSNQSRAIYLDNSSNNNINIYNNYIYGCDIGIVCNTGSNINIYNNTIRDGGQCGIRIGLLSLSKISGNYITNIQGGISGATQFGDGIYVTICSHVKISDNDISSCKRIGIVLESSVFGQFNSDISISNNKLYNITGSISPENNYGIWVEGNTTDGSIIIKGNTVTVPSTWTGNKYGGILCYGGGIISNNYLYNKCTTVIDGGGIIHAGGNTNICDNYVYGFPVGIYNPSQETTSTYIYNIKDNIIINSQGYGIQIYRSNAVTFIEDNILINNGGSVTITANFYAGAGIYISSNGSSNPTYSIKNNTFISSVSENATTGQIYGVLLSRSGGGNINNLLSFDNNTFIYNGTYSTAYPNNLTFSSISTVIPVAVGYDSGGGSVAIRRDIVKDRSNNKSNKLPNGIANTIFPTLVDLQASSGSQRHVGFGTAAPSGSLPAQVGDYIYNTSVSELGSASSKYTILGWICTVAGTPGTWVPQRMLTGN